MKINQIIYIKLIAYMYIYICAINRFTFGKRMSFEHISPV